MNQLTETQTRKFSSILAALIIATGLVLAYNVQAAFAQSVDYFECTVSVANQHSVHVGTNVVYVTDRGTFVIADVEAHADETTTGIVEYHDPNSVVGPQIHTGASGQSSLDISEVECVDIREVEVTPPTTEAPTTTEAPEVEVIEVEEPTVEQTPATTAVPTTAASAPTTSPAPATTAPAPAAIPQAAPAQAVVGAPVYAG